MSLFLALVAAALFSFGTYLLLQRTLTRIVLGIALLGHGTVLLLQVSGGRAGEIPLVGPGDSVEGVVDPLPEALALTAIVITFGITAFLLALAYRSWVLDDTDEVQDDIEDRRVSRARDAAERRRAAAEVEDLTEFADDEPGPGAAP